MLIGSRVQNRNADMDLTAIAMDIVATACRTAPPVNRPRLFVSRAGCPTAARAPFGQHEEGGGSKRRCPSFRGLQYVPELPTGFTQACCSDQQSFFENGFPSVG